MIMEEDKKTLKKESKIFIAGHRGMVGSSIWRNLEEKGFTNLVGKSSNELDLRVQSDVEIFFEIEKPDVVIDAAARVGGILANNSYPYQFLMDNLQIQNNLISTSLKYDVKKFVFLGSSCIYPKISDQPIAETSLLTGALEPTNEWYAIAKITGVKSCEAIRKQYGKDFVCLMPTNLYGFNDNFDLATSHVLPAMIRKFHDAKMMQKDFVELWGSGKPLREFLFVDDLAEAVFFTLNSILPENLYNVGYGSDISIEDLANKIKEIIGFEGRILWDSTKPDGTFKKLMDSTKMKSLGWSPKVDLDEGILKTYNWFLSNLHNYKKVIIN